jgi:CRISPR/Cas system-associated exonuclease Cas4 (RecB family)
MIEVTGRDPIDLHRAIRRAVTESQVSHRPPQMWASALPLCPKAFWLEARGRPRMDTASFAGDVRMNKGSAIHSALQAALARAGILWGDWSCRRCSTGYGLYRAPVRSSFPPPPCPEHGPLSYEEVRVEVDGISGRVDGIVCPTRRLADGVYIVEWKTTERLPEPEDGPKPQHAEQANFYACALRDQLKILGTVVQYRYTTSPMQYVSREIVPSLEHFEAQRASARYIREHLHDEQPLWGICDRGGDPYFCGYRDYCERTRHHE